MKKVEMYKANDNTLFESQDQCIQYEQQQEILKKISSLIQWDNDDGKISESIYNFCKFNLSELKNIFQSKK
jgi:hypothetical protein